MGLGNVGLTARVHFVAHTPVILAHGNKQAAEFGSCGLSKGAHVLNELAGFGASLLAKALVGDSHEFFSVDVVYHADRRVLRSLIPIIVVLTVIALGGDIGLRMNVSCKVNTDPRRTLYVKAIAQVADRRVTGFKYAVLPARVGWGDGVLADGDESATLAFEPVAICW